MRTLALTAAILLSACTDVPAPGGVVRQLSWQVVDGDTLRADNGELIRLVGIDAPELPGHCRRGRQCAPGDGWQSKWALEQRISGVWTTCYLEHGRDYYGRLLGTCWADYTNINLWMVQNNWAIPY